MNRPTNKYGNERICLFATSVTASRLFCPDRIGMPCSGHSVEIKYITISNFQWPNTFVFDQSFSFLQEYLPQHKLCGKNARSREVNSIVVRKQGEGVYGLLGRNMMQIVCLPLPTYLGTWQASGREWPSIRPQTAWYQVVRTGKIGPQDMPSVIPDLSNCCSNFPPRTYSKPSQKSDEYDLVPRS